MRWLIAVVVAAALAAGASGCSSTDRSTEAFCAQLGEATGPTGAEVTVLPGDPSRVDAVVDELESLLERAPDDIATTISTLIEVFDTYQRAPREERRTLLAERQQEIAEASARLDAYALAECGLFLQRAAPTPIATSDPGIEVAPE